MSFDMEPDHDEHALCRQEIHEQQVEIERLREALNEAAEMTDHEADRTLIYNYCKEAAAEAAEATV